MKRIRHSVVATIVFSFPISLLSMTTDKTLSIETIRETFEKITAAIIQKSTQKLSGTPRKRSTKKKRRITSYAPNADQDWEIVVVD